MVVASDASSKPIVDIRPPVPADPIDTGSSRPAKNIIFPLLAIVALAFLLRIVIFHFYPGIYWADEIFQTQEPAHKLAYGPGIVTWEYRLGLRSWVLPVIIAGIMKTTAWMGPGSSGYVFAIAFSFTLLSLSVVWFAFAWSRWHFGLQAALLAAFSTAIWFELVNFGPRALNELVAGNLFLPAIYWGALPSAIKAEKKWRLILVGILLALTACLRIQFAPAALLAGLWITSRNWKSRVFPVCSGAVAIIFIFGLVDALTWSFPFYSYWAYFRENIINHRAAGFGILPWYYYFGSLVVHTGPLAVFALIGLRRSPILGWISLAILLPHTFIAHKEFRYIYPVLPILLVLAAIGQIDFLRFVARQMNRSLSPRSASMIAAAVVLTCSVVLASRFPRWQKARGGLRAFSALSQDQDACGLALLGVKWWDIGGYTYLHRPIPIFYLGDSAQDGVAISQSFNRFVSPQLEVAPFHGYEASSCRDGICVYRRPGPCSAGGSEFEINQYLRRTGN